jgi:hypothetical protein
VTRYVFPFRASLYTLEQLAVSPRFRLTKWYLDCVSQRGDAAIIYASEVKFGRVRLHYASVLRLHDSIASTSTKLCSCVPSIDNDQLFITAPALALKANWRASESPLEQTVFESSDGSVHWKCLQPKSMARIQCGQMSIEGIGYAECLTLTIPPWRLPLEQLQWGRFHSAEQTIVWIDWAGAHTGRWLWQNGGLQSPKSLTCSEICLDNATKLSLDCVTTLREGELGTTVLPAAPLLRSVFPRTMFGVHEQKWLSRGTYVSGSQKERGWAIHEVVNWTHA